MKKFIILVCLGLMFAACGAKNKIGVKPEDVNTEIAKTPGEKLLWSSSKERPVWTVIEPEIEGEYLYFVGLSEMHATEQKARDAGMRNAVNNIVGYLGTTVKDKFESIITRFGLSSEIADPTTASRQYEQQVKENIANSVKAKEWYIEQWQTKNKQIYWKTYLLARVPKSSIEQSLQNETAKAKDKLKDALDKATNEKAKQQFNDALSAFEAMEKSGLVK
ncbi:MAG TPA: hypothetical protein PLJ38_12025 [bacterium]|nr:hypothetical protein [bacterium]